MDGCFDRLYSVIESALRDTAAQALKERAFIVYPEPEGLPPDITAEFRNDVEYFQNKLVDALGVPAEFIKPRAMGITEEFIQPDQPTGKLYWLDFKYKTQPFELRFHPLRKLVLIKTNIARAIS